MYPGVHSKTQPEKAAIIMAPSKVVTTYAELDSQSNAIAHLLQRRGLVRGDHLAIWMVNSPEFLSVAWAAQRSGLYYTPISTRLTPGECRYIVDDCDAKALFVSEQLSEKASSFVQSPPLLVLEDCPGEPLTDFESLIRATEGLPLTPVADETNGSAMMYSSGTTGQPKGVWQPLPGTNPATVPSIVHSRGIERYGFTENMVYLSMGPLYHAAPMRYTMAVHGIGGTTVVMDHFDALTALSLIERYQVTHVQAVPTMLIRLLRLSPQERARFDLSSLVAVLHAGAPCPIWVKEEMIEWIGPKVFEYYAGTEANGFCTLDSIEWLAHKGSVGRPLDANIHICDTSDGTELPIGAIGSIYFEGRTTFKYYKDPDKTAASRHPLFPTWSTLGDIGYLDADGYLYLTDRLANVIISGGVNIYPQEAENVLARHPKVVDVAVIGIPNEEFGEEVKAVVQPLSMDYCGPEFERELIDYCCERLAKYKCPRSVDFRADLPRLPTGKLRKKELRDSYWVGEV
jgi:long-chain acyl-CoA synthetase